MLRLFALGRPVKLFGGFQFARANDSVFATRFEDNTLAVFDTATGQPVAPPLPPVERSPNDPSLSDSVGLSPDGRWAYSVNWYGFHVRDVATGHLRVELLWKAAGRLFDFDFSADGAHVLVVVTGATVHVWSLGDGKPLKMVSRCGRSEAMRWRASRLMANVSPSSRGPSAFNSSDWTGPTSASRCRARSPSAETLGISCPTAGY